MFRLLPGALAARGGKKDSDVDVEESSPGSASTVQVPQSAKSNFLRARNSVGWSGAENWPLALLCVRHENQLTQRNRYTA